MVRFRVVAAENTMYAGDVEAVDREDAIVQFSHQIRSRTLTPVVGPVLADVAAHPYPDDEQTPNE